MGLKAARRCWLVGLATLVVLLGITGVANATNTLYWYGNGNSTCWQTGPIGYPSEACDSVGSDFLTAEGSNKGGLAHMDEISSEGIGEDINLSADGDYCNYYKIGDDISRQETNNQGGVTGFTTPTPYGNYQESDGHGNVCQANGSDWGQEVGNGVAGNNCNDTCGMHHYVSFHEQGLNDRPWASAWGEPSLVVSAEADPYTFTPFGTKSVGGWGYVCPVLEDSKSGDVLEYCIEEWRSKYNGAEWGDERVGTCSGGGGHNLDTLVSIFYPSAQYVTEYSGSANSLVFESTGTRHFIAGITTTNLLNGIKADRAACPRPESAMPSLEPANYALIGVEQGIEAWGEIKAAGGSSANLQLYTTYQPLPPVAATEAATGVQQFQATLNGKVNPNGVDTHYYFQYGTTTSYGSTVPASPGTDIGSGVSTLEEGATATGLLADTTYHYRIVATNSGGTSYGADHEFTTELTSTPSTLEQSSGNQEIYYRSSKGVLSWWFWNASAGTWTHEGLGSENAMAGDPFAIQQSNGNQEVYYRSGNGILNWWFWNTATGTWTHEWLGSENAMAGNPFAIQQSNGNQEVYYRSSTGVLRWWFWNASAGTWTLEGLGSENAMAGNPFAVQQSNGNQQVYYRSSTGVLRWWFWNASAGTWTLEGLGSENAMAGNPFAVQQSNGNQQVYYRSSTGVLRWWFWNASAGTWTLEGLGSENAMAGNPFAVQQSNGNQEVYYRSGNEILNWWSWNATAGTWTHEWLGSEPEMGGEPAPLGQASGNQEIYYGGTNGLLNWWFWNSSAGTWSLEWLSSTSLL